MLLYGLIMGKKLTILAGLASLGFNNWLLGLFLNYHLLSHRGAISELSAIGQPHQLVFRSLDVISGALFVALAVLFIKAISRGRGYLLLVLGTAALGLANAIDALYPLPCSETLSNSCVIPVHVSLSQFNIPSHGYSSILIAICYLLLPVGGWLYANHYKLKNLRLASVSLVVLALAYLTASIIQYAITGSFSDKAWGPTQEVQMLSLGVWFIVLARAVQPKPSQQISNH